MKYELIDTEEKLRSLADKLGQPSHLFLDTEFESRKEYTRLCMVQLRVDDEIWLLDTVAVEDLSCLRPAFDHPDALWIVHAGRQDVALLTDALKMNNRPQVFDTQVAWSLVGPEYQVSLAYLEAVLTGRVAQKGRQTDNWLRRPLPRAQLDYASEDVEFLPEIYNRLQDRLRPLDRSELVVELSGHTLWPVPSPPAALTADSYRGLWQLDLRQRAALDYIINWYNGLTPHQRKHTPHRKVLFSVASRIPEDMSALHQIKGVNRRWAAQHGSAMVNRFNEILDEIPEGRGDAVPTPYITYAALHRDAWLQCARAEVCEAVKMAPEIAFPSWLMKELSARLAAGGTFESAADVFTDWRRCLVPAWEHFCAGTDGDG